MGHERIGFLPKTKQWRKIVAEMGVFPAGDVAVSDIASDTLRCVRSRYAHIHEDPGIQAVFEFLIGLASLGGANEKPKDWVEFPVDFRQNPSALRITSGS